MIWSFVYLLLKIFKFLCLVDPLWQLDRPDLVQALLGFGAKVNTVNKKGVTPRHKAAGSLGPNKLSLFWYLPKMEIFVHHLKKLKGSHLAISALGWSKEVPEVNEGLHDWMFTWCSLRWSTTDQRVNLQFYWFVFFYKMWVAIYNIWGDSVICHLQFSTTGLKLMFWTKLFRRRHQAGPSTEILLKYFFLFEFVQQIAVYSHALKFLNGFGFPDY